MSDQNNYAKLKLAEEQLRAENAKLRGDVETSDAGRVGVRTREGRMSELEKRIGEAVHACSTWCEFAPESRAEHCDGSCRRIAEVATQEAEATIQSLTEERDEAQKEADHWHSLHDLSHRHWERMLEERDTLQSTVDKLRAALEHIADIDTHRKGSMPTDIARTALLPSGEPEKELPNMMHGELRGGRE